MDYELDPDKIINWAVDHADYADLEKVAKTVYGIYGIRRKREFPDEHKQAKQFRNRVKGWDKTRSKPRPEKQTGLPLFNKAKAKGNR